MKTLVSVLVTVMIAIGVSAQSRQKPKELRYSHKFTLGTDLIQPFLLGGINLNATYTTNRFIFDWSHGQNLTIGESIQSDEQKELNLELEIPWTTGPGVGYRFTNTLDARFDFKAHGVEANLLNGQQTLDYTAYTAGPGVFYRLYLGKKTGFGLEFSARYWFELGNNLDNLDDSNFNFTSTDGQQRSFDTNVTGGFGANVALIYTFGRTKPRNK